MYKLVALNGIQLIEFIITSLPEEFLIAEEADEVKNSYYKQFDIEKDNYWVRNKIDKKDDDDLPF